MSKINFGRKLLYMANAVAHGVRPKKYSCRFMKEGLTNYPGDGGKDETWLLPRAIMTAMQESFIGCPVIAKHNVSSTAEDFQNKVEAGEYDGIVSRVWTDSEGWDCAEFLVWTPEVIDRIDNQGWTISCAYTTKDYIGGGTYNAIPFDHEVTNAEYIHMAIVDNPRQTGAVIMQNSIDTEKENCIIFHMNGKDYKLFPKGKVMANSKWSVKIGPEEYEVEAADEKSATEAAIDLARGEDGNYSTAVSKPRKMSNDNESVAPEGWEDVVLALKKQPGVENPFATAWAMKKKGFEHSNGDSEEKILQRYDEFKKSEGGNNMTEEEKKAAEEKAKKEAEEKAAKESAGDLDIDKAVIETPEGDVPLKNCINAWQEAEKEKAEKEKAAKESEGEDKKVLTMEDEIEIEGKPIKVSELVAAHKKNADEAAKVKESEDRRASLKSEGKTDEEIDEILKKESEAPAEEEEEEGKEKMNDVKMNAAKAELEKAQKNFDDLQKAFTNSLPAEKSKPEEFKTKFEKIDDVKKSKLY